MTYLAPVPRTPVNPPAPVVPLPGRPANTRTVPQERQTRLLTEDELSPWAVKRGQFNDAIEADERVGSPLVAILLWALIGGGLWLMIIHAVYAALTGDLSLKEF